MSIVVILLRMRYKINDFCEFPMSLNMFEYTQEGLAKRDLLKDVETKNLSAEDLPEDKKAILNRSYPKSYYDYKLKGMVIHLGTADAGHYYSIINDRERTDIDENNRWYEFNDTVVREFDPKDIPTDAFGGEEERISSMGPTHSGAMSGVRERIRNAYVLFYERVEPIDNEKFNESVGEDPFSKDMSELIKKFEACKIDEAARANRKQIKIPDYIHNVIAEKNHKFWQTKHIFAKEYFNFISSMLGHITIEPVGNYEHARLIDLQQSLLKVDRSPKAYEFETLKFAVVFYLTTVVRARDKAYLPHVHNFIKKALEKNIMLSYWLLETFCNGEFIKEFLVDCPVEVHFLF